MQPTLPRYALAPISFPFRQLATLAGRAPIGGAREVALACFLAARLAGDRLAAPLPDVPRATRGTGARGWLSTVTLPTPVRAPLARCLELSVAGSTAELGAAVTVLAAAAALYLDPAARAELEMLAVQLAR